MPAVDTRNAVQEECGLKMVTVQQFDTDSSLLPPVSVLMAVRNESGYIAKSLGAVLAQEYPRQLLEIIVADGMSSDGTREIIRDLQANHPNIILIDNPGRIVAKGLNAAISIARGAIIVRVDGHTTIDPDYVHKCVELLMSTEADNVGGRMIGVGENDFARAVVLATSHPFGVGGARFHYSAKTEWVDTVYLGAWRRGLFDRIGLFDEELVRNQDDEFNYRLRNAGGRVLLSPEVKSEYVVRSKPRTLASQYFQYGYWKVRVMQKHPRQMRLSHFVPPLFVLALSGLAVLSPFSRTARRLLALLIGTYAGVVSLATQDLSQNSASKANGLQYVPVVFPLLHLSYGSGFVWGLVRSLYRTLERRR